MLDKSVRSATRRPTLPLWVTPPTKNVVLVTLTDAPLQIEVTAFLNVYPFVALKAAGLKILGDRFFKKFIINSNHYYSFISKSSQVKVIVDIEMVI